MYSAHRGIWGAKMRDNEIIFEQENILSKELVMFYNRWRIFDLIFYPVLWFVFWLILSLFIDINFSQMLLVTLLVFVPIFLFIIGTMIAFMRRIFKELKYTKNGFYAISHSGKELFVPWDNIISFRPIGNLGNFNGMGIREVPDYSLRFLGQKDYCPISADVARKIEEYLRQLGRPSPALLLSSLDKFNH